MKAGHGFTLLEILTALSILSILFLMALPSGLHLITENRTQSQINRLVAAINYARMQAITRNEKIIFCKSSDHKTCNGSWREGQIIQASNGQILRVLMSLPVGDNLTWNSSSGQDDHLELLPSGYTNGQRGSFYYCSSYKNPSYSRAIVVMFTGRTYVSTLNTEDYAYYCDNVDT